MGPGSILGMHPFLGFYIGVAAKRIQAGFHFDVRFADSSSSRIVVYNGQQVLHNHYSCAYYGINIGYAIFDHGSFEFAVSVVPGYEFLKVLPTDGVVVYEVPLTQPNKTIPVATGGKSLDTLTLAVGINLRYFFDAEPTRHLFLAGRLAKFDYGNSGGNDLSGLGITFYLGIGGTIPSRKSL